MNTEKSAQKLCPICGNLIPPDSPEGLCPKCLLSQAGTATNSPHSISENDIPPIDKIRSAFPQLEVIELIGKGGMGFVYKARQPNLDRFVALKILPDKLARDPLFAERFNREGRVLAKLNHPNIVTIYDFGQAGEFYYLLMEYVDGVNLRQAMSLGRFSPSEALKIVPKICEALQYAHEHGVLHRDIKPENILIDVHGNVKITDFGIAKLIGEQKSDITLTGTGTVLGTPHYMAPEQIESPTKVDQRADIYSLGVVFYEMLTGELPLGRFEPPSARTPVSKEVDEVVFKSLEKDKEKRFKSAQEVKTKVEHIGEKGLACESVSEDRRTQPTGAQEKPKLSAYAVVSAFLSGLGILIFLIFVVITGSKGIKPITVALSLLPALLFSCAGTVLGWIALTKMRAEPGRWLGVPLAVFGALAFPLTFITVVVVGVPYTMISTTERTLFINVIALALPCAMFAFSAWAVMKTLAWTKGQNKISPATRMKILIPTCIFFFGLVFLRLVDDGKSTQKQSSIREYISELNQVNNPIKKGAEVLTPGIIEIIGVSDSSDPYFWWTADGSQQVFPQISKDSNPYAAGKTEREIKVAFKVGAVEKFNGMKFLCPGGVAHGYAAPSSPGGNFTNVLRILYPKSLKKAVIYAGVAHGDWETVSKTSTPDYNPSWVINHDSEQWRIQFLGVLEDKEGNINTTFSYDIPNPDLYTWRIVAVTSDDVEHKALRTTWLPNTIKAVFKNDLAGKIKEYRIQVLKYKWASFDVALYPELIKMEK